MKKSVLRQIIQEEISDFFKSDSPKPKYKKGDKIKYRGTPYTVVSDSGYVVTVVDNNGKEATYNHNQLRQGVFKGFDSVNEEDKIKEYTFQYAYWYGKDNDYDFDNVTVKASSEKEARDLAYAEARKEHKSIRTSKEEFELVK
jgi:hypothetical protein